MASYITEITYTCPKCKKELTAKVYRTIDVVENPEYKEKVLSGEIFDVVCPHCGKKHTQSYPFAYLDKKHNFAIFFGPHTNLLDLKEDLDDPETREEILPDLTDSMTIIGASQLPDVWAEINALENDYDWRVIHILCTIVETQFFARYTNQHKKVKIIGSTLMHSKNNTGRLEHMICAKVNGVTGHYSRVFDEEDYQKCLDRYKERLDLIDPFVFNKEMRKHFFDFYNEDFQTNEEHMNTYYYVETDNEFLYFCSKSGCLDEIDIGSPILIDTVDDGRKIGWIKRVVNWNFLRLALDKQYQGSIVSRIVTADVNSITDDPTDPDELLKVLEHNEDNVVTAKTLKKSNLYMCLIPGGAAEDNPDEIKMEVQKVKINNKNYLAAYTDEFYLPSHKEGFKNEYFSFDTFVRIVKNNPAFDGVVINQYDQKIVMHFNDLKEYIYRRTLNDAKALMELLDDLNPMEIQYVRQRSYDCIRDRYFNEMSDDEIMSKYHLNEKQFNKTMDRAYYCLERILYARF